MLRILIKSCVLSSSYQNLFKFDTWIHCIMHINMWAITCGYIILFRFNQVSYHEITRITSNVLKRFIHTNNYIIMLVCAC